MILVTGNLGYIGCVMTRLLKESGYEVIGLDTDLYKGNTFFELTEIYLPHKQIRKDIRDISAEDLRGVEAVVHLAALSNDPLGDINPAITSDINFKATIRLAEQCKECHVSRFIFASSCSLYGISDTDRPLKETDSLHPMTAYARAKSSSEEHLKRLANDSFHPVLMRNATVYGVSPKLRLDLVVNQLAASAYLTGEVRILSDGRPWRPLIHVEDFCQAFIEALKAPVEYIHNEAFNVGIINENYRISDISREVEACLAGCKTTILNQTDSDERTYRVDFSKIKRALPQYSPRWTLRKGIRQLLSAYSKYRLTFDDFQSNKFFRVKHIRSLLDNKILNRHLYWT